MNVTYSIAPIAPLLILTNNSNDFTALVSYPNAQATVTEAILDPLKGELVVKFDYSENLQDALLVVRLTGGSISPEAIHFPDHTVTWKVGATNQLSVSAYTP
jgi:hypothetical protein